MSINEIQHKGQVEGAVKEATGKLKEKVGEAMGDPRMRARGTAEKVGGKVQRKVGDIKRVFGNSFFKSSMHPRLRSGARRCFSWKITTSSFLALPDLRAPAASPLPKSHIIWSAFQTMQARVRTIKATNA